MFDSSITTILLTAELEGVASFILTYTVSLAAESLVTEKCIAFLYSTLEANQSKCSLIVTISFAVPATSS